MCIRDRGSLSYRHDGTETSSDGFDVSLADGGEDGSLPVRGRLELSVTEVIDAAVELSPDTLHLAYGESFDSSDGDKLQSGFSSLSNGDLLDNTRYLIELELEPAQGIVELHADGTFTYVHNGSDVLVDEFSYRVTNEDGIYTIATVSVTIDPPIAEALAEVLPEFPEDTVTYVEHPSEPAGNPFVQTSKDIIVEGTAVSEKTAPQDPTSGDSSFRFISTGVDAVSYTHLTLPTTPYV